MICCWKGALVPPDGFISTARSTQSSAVPSVHEKLVTVLAVSGPFVLDAPESLGSVMFHCVVVEAPFVKQALFTSPTRSITQAFAFAFVTLSVARTELPPGFSFTTVLGRGSVLSAAKTNNTT